MGMSSFDRWLTTEPSWRREPLHFTTTPNEEGGTKCSREDFTTEGECKTCGELVGAVQVSQKELHGSDTWTFIDYWQIDEDGEHLLCESCHELETLEADDCIVCGKGDWINPKGRCVTCAKEGR